MGEGLEETIKRKLYVPDTNVLVNNPYAIFLLSENDIPEDLLKDDYASFWNLVSKNGSRKRTPNNIFISDVVEKELNNIKDNEKKPLITRVSSRRALKVLEYIRAYGKNNGQSLISGIELSNGAMVWKDVYDEKKFEQEKIYNPTDDDRIIFSITNIIKNNKHLAKKTIFVSMDAHARSKAIDKNISTEEFRYEQIDEDDLYKGYFEKKVSLEQLSKINKIDQLKCGSFGTPEDLKPNQIIVFKASSTEKAFYVSDGPGKPARALNNYNKFIEDLIRSSDQSTMNPLEKKFSKENLAQMIETAELHHSKKQKLRDKLNKYSKSLWSEQYATLVKEILEKSDKRNFIPEFENYLSHKKNEKNIAKKEKRFDLAFNRSIIPKDLQKPYVELLLNPQIGVVSARGSQGTGKTYFAMECGLYLVNQGIYDRVTYITPLVSIGGELGFLPGKLDEKIAPWMQAFDDNIAEIFGADNPGIEAGQRKKLKSTIANYKDDIYSFDVATYIKGRTIKNQFVIFDEAHFFTRDQIKVLLGRMGDGSKAVFLGDPEQTRAGDVKPYLTEKTSGFVHLASKLPGKEPYYAHITLPDTCSQRSEVAKLANLL